MKKSRKTSVIEYIIFLVSLIISFALGIIFHDYIWGPITLFFGFMNAYYMSIGKWQNYIYGILFTITYGYICTINGLYGWFIFALIVYLPLQIYGWWNWSKNKQNEEVKMKSFTWKISLLVCTLVVLGSAAVGFLLYLIPGQNLAFMDSTSQIVNVCGVVLVAIRFRESWYVWIVNNLIDLSIWIVNAIKGSQYSELTLITSVMYLIMNIIGIICWVKLERKQKKECSNVQSEEQKIEG